ncbi:carbohydrate-binding domain-containing protein [Deinococcus maricopensis]|uniref:Carbohydrate binding module xylan-binding domain-containing protein n=1 Tax=Deinococcus maricopensis (strain DSM 21211 / LMG 22137 / NRRL B-23946 / LB-34) TaxID=709986 RepID=E8U3F5_DEIML|nr:Ig-like domain-containing protein [Deinococcus maricopensis]ADV65826.1 hypothetical protein Deima_0162 [Deinococcus maricopensis DSM 21211]
MPNRPSRRLPGRRVPHLALTLGVLLGACSQPPTPPTSSAAAQLEAEVGGFSAQQVLDPRRGARVIQDEDANGGQALVLLGTGDEVRFTVPRALRAGRYDVRVRARGEQYDGAPIVALSRGGTPLGTATLDNDSYAMRNFGAVDVQPGQTLTVTYLNDAHGGPGQDRNAVVDYLTLTPHGAANVPPSVTLRTATNGDVPAGNVFEPNHHVTLEARADDEDGRVDRVDFYDGDTLVGSDRTAPYTFVLSTERDVGLETKYPRTLTARAVDNDGASTTSNDVTVVVGPSSRPTLQPLRAVNFGGSATLVDGVFYDASPAGVTTNGDASANAADASLVPPIMTPGREALVRSAVSRRGPLDVRVNVPNGTYRVYLYVLADDRARAVDVLAEGRAVAHYTPNTPGRWDKLGPWEVAVRDGALNLTGTGAGAERFAALEVWRLPQAGDVRPVVHFTPPGDPVSEYPAGQPIPLTADASDPDGRVDRVVYYAYSLTGAPVAKIGEATTAPYRVTWSGAPSGLYEVVAQAIDKTGVASNVEKKLVSVQ